MRIFSIRDAMYAQVNGHTFEWIKGSHTVNISGLTPRDIDCFTFAWEKNRPSMLDFTTALQTHLEYLEA